MMDAFHRSSIRLKGYDYSAAGGYYVTLVSFQRECLFGEIAGGEMRLNALGSIAMECWNEIPTHFPNAGIDAFVVMPDHIHGIIFIYDDGVGVVGATHASPIPYPHGPKSSVTRRARRELKSTNIWQRNYYEHILRDQTDYERIVAYILANPSRWNDDEADHPDRRFPCQ